MQLSQLLSAAFASAVVAQSPIVRYHLSKGGVGG